MLLSLLLACSSPPAPDAAKVEETKSAAKAEIVVKGSDSEVNVVQRLAEEFMKTRPDVSISVTGGGSGTGIAALIDGTTDLANSSRELKGEEKVKALEKKVEPRGFVFATDALALVVHPSNPVNQLDLEQVGRIFRGEVKDWKDVGGSPGAIGLYGRQSNSGTYDYFKSAGVKGEYAPELKQMNGTAQIVEGVAADTAGIGYAAAGYVTGKTNVKLLALVVDGQPIDPADEAAVLSGRYPLARPLFQYLDGAPTGALKDFLAYEASPAGQAIVKENGFFPIFPDRQAANAALIGG